jgi:hypothetical protein
MKTGAARKYKTPGARLKRDQAANAVKKLVVDERQKRLQKHTTAGIR